MYPRTVAASLFSKSQYWIIGPNIDFSHLDLNGKKVFNYLSFVSLKDLFLSYKLSFFTILNYCRKFKCLYPIFKSVNFYIVENSLGRILNGSNIYFANQSDRWAVLFDSISTNSKTLIQHGIDSSDYSVPHKLNTIDVFYAISSNSWQNSYHCILKCKPKLMFMGPSIHLEKVNSYKFKVLLVTEISNISIEKRILSFLNKFDIYLILKKHPTLKADLPYVELQKKYKFDYIVDNLFPKVDFVISYFSTLAYEYEACNIPCYIYYSHDDYNEMFLNVKFMKLYKIYNHVNI